MRIPLLATQAGSPLSYNVSPQECINFFYQSPQEGESHSGSLLPVHGYASYFAMPNTGAVRGMIENRVDGLLYVCADDDFYEITAVPGATDRGDLATAGGGHVSMAFNPATQEIVIIDGTGGRHFNCVTDVFSTITDADFPDAATSLAFLNGRFIVNDDTAGAGRFRWSALNDGLTWATADFTTAESLGGYVQALHEHRGVLWVMGSHATELWYNTDSTAVFERFERLTVGTVSRRSVKSFDNSVVWLSNNAQGQYNVVRAGEGYQPEVISTPEISQLIQQAVDAGGVAGTAWAYTYTLGGNEFYVLTLGNSTLTVAYNARTKLWHRMSGAFSSNNPTRWNVADMLLWHAAGTNKLIGCSDPNTSNGALYTFTQTTYQAAAANIPRRVTGPLMSLENEARLRFSEVQVDIEEGVNAGSETGDDGQLKLQYSKDGGNNYSTGVQLELGATTNKSHRLITRKLGSGRLWNFRIYTDTPNKIIIKGAFGRTYGEPLGGNRNVIKG